ncbi:MAG TPA: hypothetical protein PKA70_22965 [Saprospiraceae bacterium]|nr:hypothetical protein [Saprospiraceae bacterium]
MKKNIILFVCFNLLFTGLKSQSWEVQNPLFFGKDFESIYFSDSQNGWTVGYPGAIMNTSNGGQNWKPQISGVDNTLFDVFFVDN